MWNYIYYSIYLDHIDVSDHNAIKEFVSREIAAGRMDFFPLLVALALESETAQQLQKTMVRSVLDRFREEEHQKMLQDKRQEHEKWEERHRLKRSSFHTPSFGSEPSSSP